MVPITSLYAALAGLWLAILAGYVVTQRFKAGVMFGDGGTEALQRAIRLHGNAVEYVPIALILLLCLELEHGAPLTLHLAGLLLIVGRVVHAIGLGRTVAPSRTRATGFCLTMAAILLLVISLFLRLALFVPALFMHH